QKATLTQWPTVFLQNILMMVPLPVIISKPLFLIGAAFAVALKFLRLRKSGFGDGFAAVKRWILDLPSVYYVLACTALVPSFVMGYITPWWEGYFRYVYPYSPA